jgi:hypothetical protein
VHVARYSGSNRGRIFDGTNHNWLSGFWSNNAGVAYHNEWFAPGYNPVTGEFGHANWVMSVDKSQAYRQNAGESPTGFTTTATRSDDLAINYGYYTGGTVTGSNSIEVSDWNVAEVIVFSKGLTFAEVRQVESYLVRKYGLTGVNKAGTPSYPLTPKSLAANKTGVTTADRINLTWTAPNDSSGITDYKVEFKKTSDSAWTTFADGTSTTTSATVTGLDGNTSYEFRVAAVYPSVTNTPNSATASASTLGSSTVTITSVPTTARVATHTTWSQLSRPVRQELSHSRRAVST